MRVNILNISWNQTSDPPNVFGTNNTCLPTYRFARILPNMQRYFHNNWSMQISLRESQSGKIRTRKNSVFGHFSRSVFSWDRPWYSDECTRRLHYISYLDSLGLVSQKHRNGFQSGDLLKIPPTSLFMEEFGLYIQKKVSLKNMKRLNFPKKITKSLKKYVSNATSSIRRLFTSA